MMGFFKRLAPTHFAQTYKPRHDKQFHLFEARRGRGKSYTLTYWALQAALEGTRVLANFHINHYWMARELLAARRFSTFDAAYDWCVLNVVYADNWDQIMLAYNCLILLDEVNRLFDSLDRGKEGVPKVVMEWLQQSRRNKITLVFAAQSMDWLSVRIRQLFDVLWRAKKELDKKGNILRFWIYGSDPWSKGIGSDIQREADFKMNIPFNKRIFRLYDTLERIKAIEPESEFRRFFDVYQYQLRHNIVPRPSVPKPVFPCRACWRLLGMDALPIHEGRREAAASAPRAAEPTAGPAASAASVPSHLAHLPVTFPKSLL